MKLTAWPQKRAASSHAHRATKVTFPQQILGLAEAGIHSWLFLVSLQPVPWSAPVCSSIGTKTMEAKFATRWKSFFRKGKGRE